MQSGSGIFDVIGSIREQILELKLAQSRLSAQQEMLEGFTWNLIRAFQEYAGEVEIVMEDTADALAQIKEEGNGSPTLF